VKWLANTEGSGKNAQLNLREQVFNEGSLKFGNVVVKECRIAILLLPPEEALLDREE